MDEMRLHSKAFVGDAMLTRVMEVKLNQCIAIGAYSQDASIVEIKLDRMTIIDDCISLPRPGEFERCEPRLDRAVDGNGRLSATH
jgi:predicted nuclease with RNAse H fold